MKSGRFQTEREGGKKITEKAKKMREEKVKVILIEQSNRSNGQTNRVDELKGREKKKERSEVTRKKN